MQGIVEDALGDQRAADFDGELVGEPVDEPAHFNARADVTRQQPMLAKIGTTGLVEILGDDARVGHRRVAFFDQHRRRAGGIKREKFGPALPWALLDEPRRQAVLAQRQPDEARMRTERLMQQGQHEVPVDEALTARAS